jgi:hypothetical protein
VLQSNEQFVLDHCVHLNITHVSLPKGGTGKRCDYVYDGPGTTHVIFVLYLYDATFIFQEPLRVHVITSLSSSTLRKADVCYIQMYTMVQDELTDVTKGMQEEDLVQVTLECPDLDFPIRLPFIQMNQLTSELLLTEIERVLQSSEQFVLDHCVQLNITHVSLPKGGTGKRCDYVDTERFLKDKR